MQESSKEYNEIAPSTAVQYAHRCMMLNRRYENQIGGSAKPPHPTCDFVAWLISTKPNYSSRRWYLYRAATIWGLEYGSFEEWCQLAHGDREAAIDMILDTEAQPNHKSKGTATSSLKLIRVTDQDFMILAESLKTSKCQTASDVLMFLEAAILTGLRPCEWANTIITQNDRNGFTLVVENAKQGPNRAYGEYRTLHFPFLPNSKRSVIEQWLDRVIHKTAGSTDEFKNWYGTLKKYLQRRVSKLWPRRKRQISFYSARHEAAARFKLLFIPTEVAAMMGHATDLTNTSHYARPRKGKDAVQLGDIEVLLPDPDPDEVARIRLVHRVEFNADSPTLQLIPKM